jgi:hypothetical protein
MTVYLVISLPKIPYIHLTYMVLANPTHMHYYMSGLQILEHTCMPTHSTTYTHSTSTPWVLHQQGPKKQKPQEL